MIRNPQFRGLRRSRARVANAATLALFSLLIWSVTSPATARSRHWDPKKDLGAELKYEIGYDSNILELSDYDIDRYLNHTLPLVTDVESYDALVQSAGFKLTAKSPRWWGWRQAYLSYTFSYLAHAGNAYDNRVVHSLYLAEDVINRLDLVGSYLWIPNRYLRDYYDRDYRRLAATTFAYHVGSAGLRYSPKMFPGSNVTLRYEGFQIYYNPLFTEFDAKGWGVRLDLHYRISRHFSATLDVRKRWADNVGYSASTTIAAIDPAIDSEYGDGSYEEEWYQLSVDYRTPRVLNRHWSVNAYARLRHRYYTTTLPVLLDPFHRGRAHNHWRLHVELEAPFGKRLKLGPMFEYEYRRTTSPVSSVAKLKDFNAYRAGLSLRLNVW